jgi:hypothetical protein
VHRPVMFLNAALNFLLKEVVKRMHLNNSHVVFVSGKLFKTFLVMYLQ